MQKKQPPFDNRKPAKIHAWWNIFRVGTHRSSNGVTHTYSDKQLQAIADRYNAGDDPAPVVVGHPKDNSPAYGWVKKIRVRGGVLQAQFHQLQPDFVDAVRSGAYRQISISLRNLNEARQPLRHLGFLGGAAPAISGLGTVDWNEADNFETFDNNTEDNLMTKEEKAALKAHPPAVSDNQEASFAEREAELAKREAALHAREAQDFSAHEAKLKELEAQQAVADARLFDTEFQAFSAELKAAGIVNPLGDNLTKALLQAAAGTTDDFSEGMPLADALCQKLRDLPKTVDFTEKSAGGGETSDDFAEVGRLVAAAREVQKANPDKPWADCVNQAQAKQGE